MPSAIVRRMLAELGEGLFNDAPAKAAKALSNIPAESVSPGAVIRKTRTLLKQAEPKPFVPLPVEEARTRLAPEIDTMLMSSRESASVGRVQARDLTRKSSLMSSFDVEKDAEGAIRFHATETSPLVKEGVAAKKAMQPLEDARVKDVANRKYAKEKGEEWLDRATGVDPLNPATMPRTFTAQDTKSAGEAYGWVKGRFQTAMRKFSPTDMATKRAAEKNSLYRVHYPKDDPSILTIYRGTPKERKYRFTDVLKPREMLRAADALSHDVDASSIKAVIDDIEVPADYLDMWDPWDPRMRDALEEEVHNLSTRMSSEGVVPSSVGEEDINGLITTVDDIIRGTDISVEDVQLVKAYNKVSTMLYWESSVVRKAVDEGLQRLYGRGDFKYYDGSVDAFLQTLDSLSSEYDALKHTPFGPQVRMLFMAMDDVAKGPRYALGVNKPSLEMIEDFSNAQAIKEAFEERVKFDDRLAESRVYDMDSQFDMSASPPKQGFDGPYNADLFKERKARGDLQAGYTGQSDRLDPEFTASKGKGITEFNYADHALPGEMEASELDEMVKRTRSAEQAVDEYFAKQVVGEHPLPENEPDFMSWESLITKRYGEAGHDLTTSGAVDLDSAAVGQATANDVAGQEVFERYGATNTALSLMKRFNVMPNAPRFSAPDLSSGWREGQINVLRINDANDLRRFTSDLVNARAGETKAEGVDADFFKEFTSNEDFTDYTGITVGKRVNETLRDVLYSGITAVRSAVIEKAQVMNNTDDPLAVFTDKVILGKLLNIGETLQLGIQGVGLNRMVDMMEPWNLSASSAGDLSKRVFAVAQQNYAQVYKDTFDTMELDYALQIIQANPQVGFNTVINSRAGVDISTATAARNLDIAKRKLAAAINQTDYVAPPKLEAPKTETKVKPSEGK